MNESPKRPDVQGAEPVQAPEGSQALGPKSGTHGDQASKASVFEWVSIVIELIFIWPFRLLFRLFRPLFRFVEAIDELTGGIVGLPVVSAVVVGLVFYFVVIEWEWISIATLISYVIYIKLFLIYLSDLVSELF